MDAAALNNLTPEQVQAVKAQAQQQANMTVTQSLMKSMAELCFHKCAGSSGDRLDSREQACMASCQDTYLELRAQVTKALEKRQDSM